MTYNKGRNDTYYYLDRFYATGNLSHIESVRIVSKSGNIIIIENNNMRTMSLSKLINYLLITKHKIQPVKIKVTNYSDPINLLEYYNDQILFDGEFFSLKENQLHKTYIEGENIALMYNKQHLITFEIERSDCGLVLICLPRISSNEALPLLDEAFKKNAERRTVMYIGETTQKINNTLYKASRIDAKESLIEIGFSEVATYKNPNYDRRRTVLTKKY